MKTSPGSIDLRIATSTSASDIRGAVIKRRDHGAETLAEFGRSYNVSGWTMDSNIKCNAVD